MEEAILCGRQAAASAATAGRRGRRGGRCCGCGGGGRAICGQGPTTTGTTNTTIAIAGPMPVTRGVSVEGCLNKGETSANPVAVAAVDKLVGAAGEATFGRVLA